VEAPRREAAALLRGVGRGPQAAGALAAAIAAGLYLAVRFRDVQGFVEAVDHTPRLFHDFSHYYYATARSVSEGRGPAAGYLYTPFFALLLRPLASLSLEQARWAWGGVQVLLVGSLSVLALRWSRPTAPHAFVAVAATLLSTAVLHDVKWGQVGVLLAVLGLAATWRYAAGRWLSAALLLSVAISIKLYPVVLVAMFLLRRDLRALATSGAAVALLTWALPLAVLGERRTRRFYRKVGAFLEATADTAAGDPNSQAFASWLPRLWRDPPAHAAEAIAAAAVLLAAAALLRAHIPPETRTAFASFLALALLPFGVATSWANYFASLPAFGAFLLGQVRSHAALPRALLAAAILCALALASFPAVDLAGSWREYVGRRWLLQADLILLVAALVHLELTRRAGAAMVGRRLD